MPRRLLILLACTLIAGLLTACANNHTAPPVAPPQPAVDTAPPVPPSDLVCRNEGANVKVAWQPNVSDLDFVGFRLYRTGAGRTVTLIGEPLDLDRWVDDHPFEGVATYAVTSVDASGNESAAATMVHDFYGDTPPPRRSIRD